MEDLCVERKYSMSNSNWKQNRLIKIEQKKSVIFLET